VTHADQWVWLALIRRPQGRKGEVFADILTDFPEKFAERRRLWLLSETASAGSSHHPPRPGPRHNQGPAAGVGRPTSPREIELIHHWLHKGGIVLHFAAMDSISDAETLAGMVVAIPREDRAPLAEDEVYIGDLIGCALVDVAADEANVVGNIEDVERGAGPVPLLIVRSPKGEVLVPFAKSYLRNIDVEAKRVEMALPEGLVDLN
jgi:16S rRNA processing protein RimM